MLEGVPHAFAHTWESSFAQSLTHGNETFLYSYTEGDIHIVCPIIERKKGNWVDVVTPFGVPGFVGTQPYADFPDRWIQFAISRGYVCGYIGANMFLSDASYYHTNELVAYNQVFIQQLLAPEAEILSGFSDTRRRYIIRKWEEDAKKLTLDREKLERFFLENYHSFMNRKNAAQVYNFSLATLSAFLQNENLLISGIEENGKIQAITIFPYTPYVADYLFNINFPYSREYSSSLIWHAILTLHELGIPFLNYGGVNTLGDLSGQFKKSFHPDVYALAALMQVYDPVRYLELCRQAGVDPHDRSGYFPAYHRV